MAPGVNVGNGLAIFEQGARHVGRDIAGKNVANPLATILSVALLLRYSLGAPNAAEIIEEAVSRVLDRGFRTSDILTDGTTLVSTSQMGSAVMDAIITA